MLSIESEKISSFSLIEPKFKINLNKLHKCKKKNSHQLVNMSRS